MEGPIELTISNEATLAESLSAALMDSKDNTETQSGWKGCMMSDFLALLSIPWEMGTIY